jgi:hypothetical protein
MHMHPTSSIASRLRSLVPLAGLLAACSGGSSEATDVTLDPPATKQAGFQLTIPKFDVPEGQELQNCYFFRVPYDEDVFVNRIEVKQNDGTHHMNLFRVNTVKALGVGAEDGTIVEGGECWKSPNWSDWPLVVNSQESRSDDVNPDDDVSDGYFEWKLPDGVAQKFEPGELLMLQSHYVNVSAGEQLTPIGGKVFVNMWITPKDQVTAELGTLFATNQNINICPGEEKSFSATCRIAPEGESVTIVAANSHFHSRGKRFSINTYDFSGDGSEGPMFYENTVWDDPLMARGMDVKVPAGGGVFYTCEYQVGADERGDPEKNGCFTFGGHVEYQEHCNIFVYYYPKTRDVGCF